MRKKLQDNMTKSSVNKTNQAHTPIPPSLHLKVMQYRSESCLILCLWSWNISFICNTLKYMPWLFFPMFKNLQKNQRNKIFIGSGKQQ